MTGYHYTSADNYQKIRFEGLRPYDIHKPDLAPYFPDGIRGVWLWSRELKGDEHTGSLLWQLMTKSTTHAVKLTVDYNEQDLLRFHGGSLVEILHMGNLGDWVYHSRTPAIVSTMAIPPESIRLAEYYDIGQQLGCVTAFNYRIEMNFFDVDLGPANNYTARDVG